ncbi:MAG: precorrin-6y C5,15-methyltransferase (decarboxylating) subunit CbiE [Pseudomonadota bacterium]
MSAKAPWLTIIGLGEDGPDGLTPASHAALAAAEIVTGPPRHLALLPDSATMRVEWPVPFADGIPLLLEHRGRPTVMLASGDPFWFGAGTSVTQHLEPGEWTAHPGPSTFSLIAARLGWPLERTSCLGLHAAPLTRLQPHLAPGQRIITTLRDGDAVHAAARTITELGFTADLTVCEAMGGPRERVSAYTPDATYTHPVALALTCTAGPAMPKASGLPDDVFETDGQITKRPVRALTLSALAPRPGEHLWDIGGGSGSIAIEWLLAHPTLTATSIEPRTDRAARIRANAARLGVDHLQVAEGTAPKALAGLPAPDVVFIGGGLSDALLAHVATLPKGTRLVANAVTLETEALLTAAHAAHGGDLLRIELAHAAPLGPRTGWKPSYPIVQWSVTL